MARLSKKLWKGDVRSIAELLESPDGYVREAAAKALFALGLKASAYTNVLDKLLDEDPDLDVRIAVAVALSALGERAEARAEEAAGMLVEFLAHADREVRRKSCTALA